MKIDLLLILGFIILMILAMASGLFQNWMDRKTETDNRIWCYVRTVPSLDGVLLSSDQVVRYTRGGIDVMQKCE